MSLYPELYHLFRTKKSISIKLLDGIPNIFEVVDRDTPKSLLETFFNLEIEDYIEKNIKAKSKNIKISDLKKLGVLLKISELYDNLCNNKNIEEFSSKIFYYKNILKKLNENIDIFLSLNNSVSIFDNPINSDNILLGIVDEDFFRARISRNAYNENLDKINLAFDVLYFGNVINTKLPSVGLNSTYLLKNNHSLNQANFFVLLKQIANNKFLHLNITRYIPLTIIGISETVTDILLNISTNKLNNNSFVNFNENHMKNLIKSMIDRISINLENIYMISSKKNNKFKKVKHEYMIPFKKSTKCDKIEYISSKSELDKIKTFEALVEHNNAIMSFVTNETFNNIGPGLGIQKLDEKYYKDVLACYLFYIIRVVYDICKKYIDEIDNILKQLLDSREKRFSVLNIQDAFKYTSLLNTSLLNFKMILLNNFYELFLPSKIRSNMYGMCLDINECYVPEEGNIFLCVNETFFISYPFDNCRDHLLDDPYVVNSDALHKFIISIHRKHDLYDSSKILELGGLVFNSKITKYCYEVLREYYVFLKIANNFNIFIIEKVIDAFKEKKNIPFELIEDLRSQESTMKSAVLSDEEIDQFIRKIMSKFKLNIETSTTYYKKLFDIRKRIKNSKSVDTHNLHMKENIFYLCFNIYYIKAMCMLTVVQNIVVNIKLKNTLLKKLFELKKIYEDDIKAYIS